MIQNKKNATIIDSLLGRSNAYLNDEKNREKAVAYIYVILSLFSLSFFGIFAIGPTLSTITELNKEYEENQLVLQQLQTKNENLSKLRSQYQQIQADYPLVTNAVPNTPEASKITRQLEILASRNSLAIDKINIGLLEVFPAVNVSTPIFSFTFSLTVNGAQDNINNFLGEIVAIDRIVGVERLTTGEEQGEFTAVVTGKAFFYKKD